MLDYNIVVDYNIINIVGYIFKPTNFLGKIKYKYEASSK